MPVTPEVEDNRLSVLYALEYAEYPQITGQMEGKTCDGKTAFCATGLMMITLGLNTSSRYAQDMMQDALNITGKDVQHIVELNDGPSYLSFRGVSRHLRHFFNTGQWPKPNQI
jgi:hypothetical protein